MLITMKFNFWNIFMVCFLCFCRKKKEVIMGYPERASGMLKGQRW